MVRLLGILGLVVILYGVLFYYGGSAALSATSMVPLAREQAYFAVLTLGAAVVIITGGIDLSVGSLVALSAVVFAQLLKAGCPPLLSLGIVLLGGLLIGIIHGLMITKLRLQPFLVTLCGLFIYRGLARFSSASDVGVSTASKPNLSNEFFMQQLRWLQYVAKENLFGVPVLVLLVLVLALLLAVLLHATVYGRYLYAIGTNEQAARYAGIPTDRYKILAYMICSLLAALGGVLELLGIESASPPSAGSLYELYAITGAVLGGCSLRGGQGNVLGILLGSMVLPLLRKIPSYLNVLDSLQYTIIGLAMLLGTIGDELLKRRAARRG